jgi:uncharacterized protein (TIGR03067 family)
MKQLLSIVAIGLICGPATSAEDAPKKDQKSIRGAWVCVSSEENGVAIKGAKESRLTFTDEEMIYTSKDKKVKIKATYKVNPAKNPKQITVCVKVKQDGRTVNTYTKGIYRLEKDELMIHWGAHGAQGPLPKGFETDVGSNTKLMIYKRDKSKSE